MSPARGPAPVVVAVDAAGTARDAVDWAAAEAAARGCPLRVVHAFRPSLPVVDPYGLTPPIDVHRTVRTLAESILREAVGRARAVASDVEVSAVLLAGSPARALLAEAAGAGLLVLGSRGLRGLLARSVTVRVAAHAACPVVVIRPAHGQGDPGGSSPRVVVGVDGTGSSTLAIGFAFQAARQRGIPLVAVHAWTPDPPADLEAVCGPPALAEALGRSKLERALDRWRPEFADVPVVPTLVRGQPAPALLVRSRGAALVVVGSRGRGHVLGTVLGSVSQTVLHQIRSPLTIIRWQSIGPDQAARRGAGRRGTTRDRRWAA